MPHGLQRRKPPAWESHTQTKLFSKKIICPFYKYMWTVVNSVELGKRKARASNVASSSQNNKNVRYHFQKYGNSTRLVVRNRTPGEIGILPVKDVTLPKGTKLYHLSSTWNGKTVNNYNASAEKGRPNYRRPHIFFGLRESDTRLATTNCGNLHTFKTVEDIKLRVMPYFRPVNRQCANTNEDSAESNEHIRKYGFAAFGGNENTKNEFALRLPEALDGWMTYELSTGLSETGLKLRSVKTKLKLLSTRSLGGSNRQNSANTMTPNELIRFLNYVRTLPAHYPVGSVSISL